MTLLAYFDEKNISEQLFAGFSTNHEQISESARLLIWLNAFSNVEGQWCTLRCCKDSMDENEEMKNERAITPCKLAYVCSQFAKLPLSLWSKFAFGNILMTELLILGLFGFFLTKAKR